ncbi:sialic acid-binding Ig-like lectin 12 [Hyperolius riggenbachi]|uniref:sialic acid-binding Ig-like lectin 12 n=1 Tax=Hyperolius riggenbachi TaxID=752182 RepID=UPI0035A31774
MILISRGTVTSMEYRMDFDGNVQIPVGMCAIIPCKFVADSRLRFLTSKGCWKGHSGTAVSTDNSAGLKTNFQIVGDPNNGDCSLKITEAKKEDADTYHFRFEESEGSINKYSFYEFPLTVKVADIKEEAGCTIQADQTVTVQRGLCVTIPCAFTAGHMTSLTNARGYWRTICQETVATNSEAIVSLKPNFQLVGNLDKGDCTLRITNATEQDAGKYYFMVEYGEDKKTTCSYAYKMTTLQVTDLKEKPVISDPGTLTEGQEVTLTCTAPGNCSNVPITWRNKMELLNESSNLTFIPTRRDHNKLLTCHMTVSSLKISTQNEITLFVQYPPAVVITIGISEPNNSVASTVTVGDSLVLKCLVDSNPAAEITWMKGEKTELTKGNNSQLMLNLTDIPISGADTYYCLASNTIATTNQTITIIVNFHRSFVPGVDMNLSFGIWICLVVAVFQLWRDSEGLDGYTLKVDPLVIVEEGFCVTIPCQFTANNRKRFTGSTGCWKTNLETFVLSTDMSKDRKKTNFNITGDPDVGDCTLMITNASREDTGTYFFRFEENRDSATWYNYRDNNLYVYVADAPTITFKTIIDPPENTLTNHKATLQEGEAVILNCSVDSNPPSLITWKKGENTVVSCMSGHFLVLHLLHVTSSDSGTYSCSAQNKHGDMRDFVDIEVQYSIDSRKSDCTNVVILVVGSIFILSLITLMIFCFMQRHMRRQQQGDEKKGTKCEEQKDNLEVDENLDENIYANM